MLKIVSIPEGKQFVCSRGLMGNYISSNSGPWSMYSTSYSDFPFNLYSHWLSCKIYMCVYFYEIVLMFARSAVFEWSWTCQARQSPLTLPHTHYRITIHAFLVRCKRTCKFCMCEIALYYHTPNSLFGKHQYPNLWFQKPMQFLNSFVGWQMGLLQHWFFFFPSIYHFCSYLCSGCKLM